MTPSVRVMMPTYRRHRLLERALESLRAQTFSDWVCEVHNDDPGDPWPGALVSRIADPRIRVLDHRKNFGAVETFNLCYRECDEPFLSILEDDNHWEPVFLERMLGAAAEHPDITLLWSNQKIVCEEPNGTLSSTEQTVRRTVQGTHRVRWGGDAQAFGGLHSNSAMLLRMRAGQSYDTPSIPLGGIEAYRERMVRHPLLYVAQPLGSFTVTNNTARSRDRGEWLAFQAAMVGTFLRGAAPSRIAGLWSYARSKTPSLSNVLVQSAFSFPWCRGLLRVATPGERLRHLRGFVRNPKGMLRALKVRSEPWFPELDGHTRRRFAEAVASPGAGEFPEEA